MLVIPPTLNIMLFGFALNPEVKNLRLGVVDESRTIESRELVSAFVESRSFAVTGYYASSDELGLALSAGELDAGLVVPFDYAKQRERHQPVVIQFLVDAVNSNTAAIATGYASRIIVALNQKIAQSQQQPIAAQSATPLTTTTSNAIASNTPGPNTTDSSNAGTSSDTATSQSQPTTPSPTTPAPPVVLNIGGPPIARANISSRVTLLYNPGLQNAWFIVTGMIGLLLVLQGSLVASASMVREKEVGTIEQLLMTPAESSEIITAKIAPIFILLSLDIWLALGVGRLIFGVPVRGSMLLLFIAGALCVLAGIGIGTIIATFTKNQTQAQLMGFFVNPPIALLSGATTPIEAMPTWLQPITYLNPVRHFALISRGVMLKGTGLDVLYPNMLALLLFAVILVWVSAWRFRKQLG
ncbi:MAG: hypothetical protein AUG75_04350 [Cyanobacteria bacterium 13_1_20CM_4_61_6]|nr:MAG: hypothetical protein AUG75_04350 [Cyanobacteria bacterium 13_1_20CM_4_61_6]